MGYHRSQILLEDVQYQTLARLSSEANRSMSDIARELIQIGIDALERRTERALGALAALDEVRERVERRSGVLAYDPVAEARAERARELS